MIDIQLGDLITFPLRGNKYGLAQLVHIENLSQHDNYHFVVRDMLLDGGPGGFDEFGDPIERTHDLSESLDAPIVVDHIGVTLEALLASDPLVVGNEEVDDAALDGYRLYLHFRREEAVRSGMLRGEEEEIEEDDGSPDYDVVGEEEFEDDDDGVNASNEDVSADEEDQETDIEEESLEAFDEETDSEAEETGRTVEAHSWHTRVFDTPIGQLLAEFHEIFKGEPLRETQLGSYLLSFFDGSNSEELKQLVEDFVAGDYGAGQELVMYGDAAVNALSPHLSDNPAPELAGDILNIIGDTGTTRAYELIADFFARHTGEVENPLYVPAARGYCYVVMLTGGTPEPLRPHLNRLDHITDPELADDVRMAKEAVVDAPQDIPQEQQTSVDPFRTL